MSAERDRWLRETTKLIREYGDARAAAAEAGVEYRINPGDDEGAEIEAAGRKSATAYRKIVERLRAEL
jgi:hypothetical protein